MHVDPSESCLSLTYTQVDHSNFIQDFVFKRGTQNAPTGKTTYVLSTLTTFTYKDIDDTFNIFDNPSVCTNAPYTIQTSSSLNNIVYVLGSS